MPDAVIPITDIVKTPCNLGGRARIDGRRIGVSDIVNLHLRLGAPLEEVASSYNLTFAQIHAALAYYYDHQEEIDTHLQEEDEAAAKYAMPPEEVAAERARLEANLKARDPKAYERMMDSKRARGEA